MEGSPPIIARCNGYWRLTIRLDLPSGEMAVEATADVPEDLPIGKRSRTEANEEDVEMEEVKEEELCITCT